MTGVEFRLLLGIFAKPSQAKPSQAKPSQAKPSQAKQRAAISVEISVID
ncbi:MAG: hypothetical protein GWP70_10510 [Proteobacteria bacterium]|nr:hypothetical protein [Pseudomonadota bacterium]